MKTKIRAKHHVPGTSTRTSQVFSCGPHNLMRPALSLLTDKKIRLWGVTMAKAHAGGTALGSQPWSYAARKAQSQENMDKHVSGTGAKAAVWVNIIGFN